MSVLPILATLANDQLEYLPIEWFKNPKANLWKGESKPHRTFLSSGTTQSDRSQSFFSDRGLTLYRQAALCEFSKILHGFFGDVTTHGISLIPPASIWKDSSLAQMLSWIAETMPVIFVSSAQELAETTLKLEGQPLWIFGTGYHFVHLFDAGTKIKLRKNSVVFETGGTKTQSRSVTSFELHKMMEELFSIPHTQIISEYGMCELASQAYACVKEQAETRKFCFPSQVKLWVEVEDFSYQPSGEGALIISDPLRIDYPYPLRTQDFVRLHEDGSFELLTRVPTATLKGCSLLAEGAAVAQNSANASLRETFIKSFHENPKQIYPSILRLDLFLLDFRKFLQSEDLLNGFLNEFGSRLVATTAQNDLLESLPKTAKDLLECLKTSQAQQNEKWMIILPNNHSVVGFYPLVVGFLSGLTLTVRLPQNFSQRNSVLGLLIQFLNTQTDLSLLFKQPMIACVSDQYRFHSKSMSQAYDQILCYGQNSTIQKISQSSQTPVQGYGDALSVGFVEEWNDENTKKILKDTLSLGQKGCLCLRIIFYLKMNLKQVFQTEAWLKPLTRLEGLSLSHETLRLRELGGEDITHFAGGNFKLFKMPKESSHALPRHSGMLTCVEVESKEEFLALAQKLPDLVQVSVEDPASFWGAVPHLPFICLGQSQVTPWSGLHQGTPLFLSN